MAIFKNYYLERLYLITILIKLENIEDLTVDKEGLV
jgi:hypothetical protein